MDEVTALPVIPFTYKAKIALATIFTAMPVITGVQTFTRTGSVLESIVAGSSIALVGAMPLVAYYLNNLYRGRHQPIICANGADT